MHPERNYFLEHKGSCDVFIETGTYEGRGITSGIMAGFTEIYSIDLVNKLPGNYKHGLKYNLHYGNSPDVLKLLLPKFKNRKIMFWLDAHSDLISDEDNFPLLQELTVIKKYCNDAVILIDDLLYMTNPLLTGITIKDVEKKIYEINEGYKIEYLANPVKKNILLAKL
jgi:hypothetical protein